MSSLPVVRVLHNEIVVHPHEPVRKLQIKAHEVYLVKHNGNSFDIGVIDYFNHVPVVPARGIAHAVLEPQRNVVRGLILP